MYHSTVMQRPEEEREGVESARRDRTINGGPSSSNTNTRPSPTQTEFHSPYSPTNGTHPRPQYNNPYHPSTPAAAALPMPIPSSHISGPPASPRILTAPSSYQSEYQPVPREKPTSNYYDPTSDSGERRPSESAAWSEGQNSTPQVRRNRTRLGGGALCQFIFNVIF